MIPAGTYACRLIDQGLSKTQGGNPFLYFDFEVLAKIEKNGDRQGSKYPIGRRITKWLTDAAFDYTLADLKRLGVEIDTLSRLDLSHASPVSLVGRDVKLYCKHKDTDNGPEESWNICTPQLKLNEAELSSLDSILARRRGAAPAFAELDQTFTELPIDDDVPF